MATARDLRAVKTEKGRCKRSSAEFKPPYMSELRIVLLGRSGELKSKVGNIILGSEVLSVGDQCERAQGLVNGRPVVLINTPDLLDPELPDRKLFYQIERCVTLSAPGPHALLLVLEKGSFTEVDRRRLERILHSFSDEVFKYSVVALVTEKSKGVFNIKDLTFNFSKSPVHKVVEKCSQKCYTLNNTEEINSTQVTKLMEQIEQMVEQNGGGFLSCEIFKEPESAALEVIEGSLMGAEQKMERKQKPQARTREQQQMGKGEKVAVADRLNLVLFGRSGAGKTFVGNTILGQRESNVDPSSSSVCERREGEVCGRLVTVVEMPALCESQLSASTVSHLCASLCGPGVHAFLLVIPAASLTNEDKAEITRIQEIFGSRVTEYMMVLFTHESSTAELVLDFLQQNKDTRELLEICSKRFCVFNNQDIVNNTIVTKLLMAIEEMNRATESCFSLDMYWEAQLEKKVQELKEKDRKIRELEDNIKAKSLVSELRIVLLGRSGELKSKVGNIILGKEAFETEPPFFSEKQQCVTARGLVHGRYMTVINTPDLLHPQVSQDELDRQIESCVSLSDPGPHVLLVVLQPEGFTQKDRKRMRWILTTLGDQAFNYTMVLITHESKKTDACIAEQKDPTEDPIIKECRGRHYMFSNIDKTDHTQKTEFMEKMYIVVKENEGRHLTCEIYKEVEEGTSSTPEESMTGHEQDTERENKSQALSVEDQKAQEEKSDISRTEQKMERKHEPQARSREQQQMEKGEKAAEADKLNLVLFGSSGAGKTSAGNAILGRRESSVDHSPSSVCERREGEVCGCLVTVVEMPALCESQLSASTVSRLCASLCGPGVHAFLMVIPSAHLTDEDKAEITKIQEIFGSRVTDYMMAFFTHESPTAELVLDILQQNEDTRELLEICSNRFCVFNNQDIVNNPIVPKLLKAIEEMNIATESCFSLDMYLEAQLEKVRQLEARHKMELEEKDRKIRELEQNIKGTSLGVECKDQNSDCVRIVLVGKTGSGKSATGNTILQREEFKSEPSSSSVTTRCKKGVGEVAGRRVAVVDTPGLFDTEVTNEEVQQEMAKCISFLAPGPHVFLIVLQIGRFTKEEMETLQLIKSTFGKNAEMFTIVIFTRGDDLNGSIDSYIKRSNIRIQSLIQDCGNRFHVFNNKDKSNRTQVSELLDKIDSMVNKNGGGCYTNEMFQEAEMTIKKECERILREKEDEMQRVKEVLKAKHEEEMKEMQSRMEEQRLQEENERKRREKELKDKEEHLRKEREEWKKREQEEKERRDEEEKKKKEKQELKWKREMDKIEKEKSRMKEEWKRREDEEKNRVEREEKQRQEMIEKQSRERKEFEEKQAEEKKKRDRQEQERKYHEERERREWEQKMKEAEKEKKEIQEDMKRRAEKWELQREDEQVRNEEMERKRKQKEEQERREWDEKQKKMRDEFEKEREQERQRRDKERRDKEEMMERDLEEQKRQLKKQQEEWDKERKQERERRDKEDEQRREEVNQKLAKQQEEFEREREEEYQKRKMEDVARRQREEKERKKMEEHYEGIFKEMKRKYEEDAREKAVEYNDFKVKFLQTNKANAELISQNTNLEEIKRKYDDARENTVGYDHLKVKFSQTEQANTQLLSQNKNLENEISRLKAGHQDSSVNLASKNNEQENNSNTSCVIL